MLTWAVSASAANSLDALREQEAEPCRTARHIKPLSESTSRLKDKISIRAPDF